METHPEFEMFARDYLKHHPDIKHEWRRTEDETAGGHTDLICAPDTEHEVVATLRPHTIAVGDKNGQVDFEDVERSLTGQQLAAKALAHLIRLLDRSN